VSVRGQGHAIPAAAEARSSYNVPRGRTEVCLVGEVLNRVTQLREGESEVVDCSHPLRLVLGGERLGRGDKEEVGGLLLLQELTVVPGCDQKHWVHVVEWLWERGAAAVVNHQDQKLVRDDRVGCVPE
jgi:hypothetical protein